MAVRLFAWWPPTPRPAKDSEAFTDSNCLLSRAPAGERDTLPKGDMSPTQGIRLEVSEREKPLFQSAAGSFVEEQIAGCVGALRSPHFERIGGERPSMN